MTPHQLAWRWKAVWLHFTRPNYDYFKYEGKAGGPSEKKFLESKDRWIFEKLSKRRDPIEFMVSCALKRGHLGDADGSVEEYHFERRRRLEALSHHVTLELKHLDPKDFGMNFLGDPPKILWHYWGKRVSLEVMTALAYLSGAHKIWERSQDYMVKADGHLVKKYYPWLQCDSLTVADKVKSAYAQAL